MVARTLTVGLILGETVRFMRRNVRVIAVWCLLYVLLDVVEQLAFPPAPAGTTHLEVLAGVVPRIAVAFVWLIILYSACFRAVMLPGETRAFYLRVGGDELRLMGMTIATVIGASMVIGLGVAALVLLTAMLSAVGGVIGGLVGVVAILIFWGGLLYALVRLSPAWPLTIARGRFMLDEGWQLSKGAFWPMFGAYFIVWAVVIGVGIVLAAIILGPVFSDLLRPMDLAAQARIANFRIAQAHLGLMPRLIQAAIGGLVGGVLLAWHVGAVGCAARLLLAERRTTQAGLHGGPWGRLERSE